jgi:protein-tyrosine sulfotransferase
MQDQTETLGNYQRRYQATPFWIARMVQALRYNLRRLPLAKRYPLADAAHLDGRKPLFIISAGRSGTTLLRSMLVAGEQMAIPPETQIIHSLALRFLNFQFAGWDDLCALVVGSFERHQHFKLWETNLGPAYEILQALPDNQRSLARIIDTVFMTYGAQQFPNAITWGDQSPIHTFYLPWIYPTFPEAKYLHLLRDGRDVISSMVARRSAGYLEHGTYRWKTSINRVAAFRKVARPDQFLEVRYESLVSQPEETLRQISSFSGIDYTPRMLDYWKLPSTLEHRHHEHHRNIGKPVTTDSIGKWRERLTPEQQAYILSKITGELRQLGYLES